MHTSQTVEPVHNRTAVLKGDNDRATDSGTETDPDEYDFDDSIVDHSTFDQLLELDDDEHRFTRGLVWRYFDQAEEIFNDMESAVASKNFPELSRLGHFFKGSSAALGLTKIKESCEKLQRLGNLKDTVELKPITSSEAETSIRELLGQMRKEYDEVESLFKLFYETE
ncbi:hypothetical protein CPC16_004179 [Podila verticillata]|nr:hypothetical protein BGZ52_005378 [Haplosporangium bisporale]KAF9210336.1 hypothetical protein BGZ59_009576 [Podila verticillata]KAF9391529.1 hypothetical protein CPC16_004179 [Podila verticillata]KAI9234652.1 MAG: signal transduction histidine kinase [Podila humilis]KFH70503.1 hypothetical protein MVEG_03353 [Podila verticillata NRRL 6337]